MRSVSARTSTLIPRTHGSHPHISGVLVSGAPRLALLVMTMVFVFAGVRPTAASSPCVTDLEGCYSRAAGIDNLLDRWLAGIDCELAFAECIAESLCK